MKIAVTSGKGGTGKTTVSTGLYFVLSRYMNYHVRLLDCDVEEPDCHILIKAVPQANYPVTIAIPEIDEGKCTFCGKCKNICAFNAIVLLPSAGFIEVVPDLCHGCGACSYVCPADAIVERDIEIGTVNYYGTIEGDSFIEGRMKVGKTLQTRMIRETIRHSGQDGIILYDSPPGTSCPVVATVSRSDYAVMVTESTPFGL